MPANTSATYTIVPNNGFGKLTAANTAQDGTGTVLTLFTAGANGSRVPRIVCQALGTNVASLARFFINNGSTQATAGNNAQVTEVALPATTQSQTVINQALYVNVPGGGPFVLKAGYTTLVTLGTAVSAGWMFSTPDAGDY